MDNKEARLVREPREQLIDLVGKHDAIYLFALSSATLGVLGLFDALFRASMMHLLNTIVYLFNAYQTSHRLMSDQ